MLRTYDCEPTLNDSQVLEFCQNGFLMLEGVVPDEINKKAFDFLEEYSGRQPIEILEEGWFVEEVLLHPRAAGAVRSLLGKNFGLTMPMMANHRVECPFPGQQWHRDGGSVHGPELDCLQVFYYPQDTPVEMGPTEVLPGSHLLFALQSHMHHYGSIRGAISAAAPAGSIFLTIYPLWHRRTASTARGTRNLLKYWYTRTAPPARDWIIEPGFELTHAYHSLPEHTFQRDSHLARNEVAEVFYWLCGKHNEYRAWKNNLPVYYNEKRKLCKFCGYQMRQIQSRPIPGRRTFGRAQRHSAR